MIETGILDDQDKVELLEGHVVLKMPRNPTYDGSIDLAHDLLTPALPAGWFLRIQEAITLVDSEPEPDLCAVRGTRRSFLARHPGPADVGLLVEVADSSLDRDRNEKQRVYALARIPNYWIVNLIDRQVEVHMSPDVASGSYANQQVYSSGDSVPLALDGTVVATIPVAELLP